jgi:hypothetical protein
MTLGVVRTKRPSAHRTRSLRALQVAALALAVAPGVAEAETERETETERPSSLPPPRVSELQMRASVPQWDVGLTLGGGVYERGGNYDHAAFRLGLELDSLYLRRHEADFGLGWTISVSTLNFADSRLALGVLGILEVVEPISVELGLRGLVLTDGNGASPGLNPELRFGLRSLNLKGHYSHAHLLAFGADLSFAVSPTDERPRAAFYAALRGDVMWLVAPLVGLF